MHARICAEYSLLDGQIRSRLVGLLVIFRLDGRRYTRHPPARQRSISITPSASTAGETPLGGMQRTLHDTPATHPGHL